MLSTLLLLLLLVSQLVKSDDGTIRSRVLINNCPSSLRVLRVLGTLLVDVNAQHASLALREGQQQLQLLDRIAGVKRSDVVMAKGRDCHGGPGTAASSTLLTDSNTLSPQSTYSLTATWPTYHTVPVSVV